MRYAFLLTCSWVVSPLRKECDFQPMWLEYLNVRANMFVSCDYELITTCTNDAFHQGTILMKPLHTLLQARMTPKRLQCTSSRKTPSPLSPPRLAHTTLTLPTRMWRSQLQSSRLEWSQKMRNPRQAQVYNFNAFKFRVVLNLIMTFLQ